MASGVTRYALFLCMHFSEVSPENANRCDLLYPYSFASVEECEAQLVKYTYMDMPTDTITRKVMCLEKTVPAWRPAR
jgi:hypothetical protein